MSMIDAALAYGRRGISIFPLQQRGKQPLKGSRGLLDASRREADIRRWWNRWPNANIGLPTGSVNSLLVLDVDGAEGQASLANILRSSRMPDTVRVKTGGGGWHYYLRYTGKDLRNSAAKLGKGLDIRGEGGYVVAPPSIHESGRPYAWAKPKPRIGEAPAWLVNALRLLAALKEPAAWQTHAAAIRSAPPWLRASIDQLRKSQRPIANKPIKTASESRAFLLRRARMYIAACEGVPTGGRNQKLFAIAGNVAALVGRFGETLGHEEITILLREFNGRCQPPLPEKELALTVRSAMKNGTPREPKPMRSCEDCRVWKGHQQWTTG